MSLRVLLPALGVQTLAVAVIFVVLLALPLERDFFREWGAVTGPLAWIVASLITWHTLDLRAHAVTIGAVGGGAVGFVAALAIGHGPGLPVALAAFAVLCATLRHREAAEYPQPDSNR